MEERDEAENLAKDLVMKTLLGLTKKLDPFEENGNDISKNK